MPVAFSSAIDGTAMVNNPNEMSSSLNNKENSIKVVPMMPAAPCPYTP